MTDIKNEEKTEKSTGNTTIEKMNLVGATLDDLATVKALAREASPYKEKNIITNKKAMRECRNEFSALLIEGFAGDGPNSIEDKKFLKSVFKLIFQNAYASDMEAREKDEDLKEIKTPLEEFVEKFLILALALDYLKNNSLRDILKKYNVNLDLPKLEELRPYFNSDSIRDTFISYLETAKNIQTSILGNNIIIEGEIFDKLPTHLKYDKETNQKGLKSSKFNDLLKFEVISKIDKNEAEDQYEKMSKKIYNKSCSEMLAQIAAQTMIVEPEKK